MYGCVNWWNIVGFGIQTNEHLDSPCQILQKFNHVTVLDVFICFTTTRLYSTFTTRYSFTAWITQSSINPLIYSYYMIEFPNNWVCFIRGFPLMRCILDYIALSTHVIVLLPENLWNIIIFINEMFCGNQLIEVVLFASTHPHHGHFLKWSDDETLFFFSLSSRSVYNYGWFPNNDTTI